MQMHFLDLVSELNSFLKHVHFQKYLSTLVLLSLREEFNSWKEVFFAGRPLVPEQLSQGGQKAIERLNALDDLRAMLNDKNVNVKPKTQQALNSMLRLYDNYKEQKQQLELVSGSRKSISALKDQTILQIKILSETNENTKAAYNVLFGSLLGE